MKKHYIISEIKLLAILRHYNLSYAELARILGSDSGTISRWISGERIGTYREDIYNKVEILSKCCRSSNFTRSIFLWLVKKL